MTLYVHAAQRGTGLAAMLLYCAVGGEPAHLWGFSATTRAPRPSTSSTASTATAARKPTPTRPAGNTLHASSSGAISPPLSGAFSAEVVDGGLDRAVERGVGVDHLAEPPHRNPGVERHGERAEDLTTPRGGRGGAHENPPLGILDQLDEAVVAGLVDPAPGGTGNLGAAHPDRRAPFLRLSLGQADRAD